MSRKILCRPTPENTTCCQSYLELLEGEIIKVENDAHSNIQITYPDAAEVTVRAR